MSEISQQHISVTKATSSKINEIDFDALVFGKNYTDHMFECDYVDGAWRNPSVKPFGPLTLSPATKVFHYGQAVFEGMKAFESIHSFV